MAAGGALAVADMKLPKLPDRTPIRLTIASSPELAADLALYAEIYETTYSQRETTADLIPFMLAAFLASDRAFGKERKAMLARAPRTSVQP